MKQSLRRKRSKALSLQEILISQRQDISELVEHMNPNPNLLRIMSNGFVVIVKL